MTFLQSLFRQIAGQINKPYSDFLPFIKILQDNWFDSEQALLGLSDEQFESMKIPKRLVFKIRQVIKKQSPNKRQQPKQLVMGEFNQSPKSKKKQQMFEPKIAYVDIFDNFFESLKLETMLIKHKMLETLQLLQKILENILKSPQQEKFRKIKTSNKKFVQCMSYNCCNYIIQFLGFFRSRQQISMPEVNLSHLNICLKHIQDCIRDAENVFDPYQASYNSCSQMPNAVQIANEQGSQVTQYNKMLDELIQHRKKIMSNSPKDRCARIYHKKLQKKDINFTEVVFQDQISKSQDPTMREYWKRIISMNHSSGTFQSKRKMQFEALLKQSVYDKTVVKIKMPNDYILQGYFGPLQKIQKVVSFAKSFVHGDVYIFTTPPVVQMSKHLNKTLNQMQCVPVGIFYLGCNDNNWAIKNEYVAFIEN